MGSLIQSTAPVFGLILVGYCVGWFGGIEQAGIAGLGRFTFRVAIPVMLVRAMANVSFSETIEWPLMAAYYGGTLVAYGAGALAGKFLFGYPLKRQAAFGLGSSYSNIVVIGIPTVLLVFGDAGELPLYMILSCNAALLFFVAKSLQVIAGGTASGPIGLILSVLKTNATNPVIVGLFVGLAINLAGFSIIEPFDTIAAMLGAAGPGCALFTLGASLSRYQLRGRLKEAFSLVLVKNIFHPLAVYAMAFFVFELSPLWAAVAVVVAAQPTGVNAFLFAEDAETVSSTIGAAVVVSTAVSILSVALVLVFVT